MGERWIGRSCSSRPLRAERREEQKGILGYQLDMKAKRLAMDKEEEDAEVSELKTLWKQQEQEEKDAVIREKINAKAERKKADEYAEIQRAQREEEVELEKAQDKAFVAAVLTKERLLSEKEAADKAEAKKKTREFNEALKLEMARKAASEEELIRLQDEESERQWAKRYEQWEKEEIARRDLMTEVYQDRAEQVRLKQEMRDHLKSEVGKERERMDAEVERLEAIEAERDVGEQ